MRKGVYCEMPHLWREGGELFVIQEGQRAPT